MRVKTEFQIYEKRHRSGTVSFLVNAGSVNGKRRLPAFSTREEAERYRAALLERKALEIPAELSDLTGLAAANVRLALKRLEPYETSILKAVDFFIKFAKPPKGNAQSRTPPAPAPNPPTHLKQRSTNFGECDHFGK